jgi:hypothetical protein
VSTSFFSVFSVSNAASRMMVKLDVVCEPVGRSHGAIGAPAAASRLQPFFFEPASALSSSRAISASVGGT